MPNIYISELDQTKPGAFAENFEVVYVPGLVDLSLFEGTDKEPLEAHKPHLFTSVREFEELCGASPVVFNTDQKYTSLNVKAYLGRGPVPVLDDEGKEQYDDNGNLVTEEGDLYFTRKGFPAKACPLDRVMFKSGSEDPGYLMAKDFLSKGLSVLYERVNVELATERTNEPDIPEGQVWKHSDYAFKKKIYTHINDTEAPNWSELGQCWHIYRDGESNSEGNPINVMVDEDWELLYPCEMSRGEPSDWAENYSDYVVVKRADYFSQIEDNDLRSIAGPVVNITGTVNNNWLVKVENGADEAKKKLTIKVPFIPSDSTEPDYYYLTWNDDGDLTLSDEAVAAVECDVVSENKFLLKTMRSGTVVHQYHVQLVAVENVGGLSNAVITEVNSRPKKYVDCEISYDTVTLTMEQFLDREELSFADGTIVKIIDPYSIRSIYAELEECYKTSEDHLLDKGNYSIKYLTSGGYPTYEYNNGTLANAMINIAEGRGDCVALIDHTDNLDRPMSLNDPDALYPSVVATGYDTSYATMFTPWFTYAVGSNATRLPASYAYLSCLAKSINNSNPSWLAVAGSARGKVSGFADGGIKNPIPNSIADGMQPRQGLSINPITDIKPYGQILWGNRTLKRNGENLVANSFLNTRNMISDIKKIVYRTARMLTFEQNSDVLWINFKGAISPTLDRMVSGNGIGGYKIIKDDNHAQASAKATLCAKIVIYPIYAVEDFYITVVLKDNEVTVE